MRYFIRRTFSEVGVFMLNDEMTRHRWVADLEDTSFGLGPHGSSTSLIDRGRLLDPDRYLEVSAEYLPVVLSPSITISEGTDLMMVPEIRAAILNAPPIPSTPKPPPTNHKLGAPKGKLP